MPVGSPDRFRNSSERPSWRQLPRVRTPERNHAELRALAEQITRDEGKPEQAIPKIVEGRVRSYFKDFVLLEQPFVKDPKKSIAKVLQESGVSVKRCSAAQPAAARAKRC